MLGCMPKCKSQKLTFLTQYSNPSSLNSIDMFSELEDFWRKDFENAQKLIAEAYDRREEFGDSFRAFYLIMRRYKRNQNGKHSTK
jgi:hypothetical protein